MTEANDFAPVIIESGRGEIIESGRSDALFVVLGVIVVLCCPLAFCAVAYLTRSHWLRPSSPPQENVPFIPPATTHLGAMDASLPIVVAVPASPYQSSLPVTIAVPVQATLSAPHVITAVPVPNHNDEPERGQPSSGRRSAAPDLKKHDEPVQEPREPEELA